MSTYDPRANAIDVITVTQRLASETGRGDGYVYASEASGVVHELAQVPELLEVSVRNAIAFLEWEMAQGRLMISAESTTSVRDAVWSAGRELTSLHDLAADFREKIRTIQQLIAEIHTGEGGK